SASLDICWLACGRLDGYYESLSVWDFAAARLIALEAGAECGHFGQVPDGADPQFYDRNLLMANPVLYPKLLALLRGADGEINP
ncbi:MAG TPA: inositol monophosphatase, partial [Gammaproteobacteria bacterium]|nr:inositol monophosphatase [Gammaproteobacteria bacterium]